MHFPQNLRFQISKSRLLANAHLRLLTGQPNGRPASYTKKMDSAQKDLARAIESGDAKAQVEANKKIATLAFDNARLQQSKETREETGRDSSRLPYDATPEGRKGMETDRPAHRGARPQATVEDARSPCPLTCLADAVSLLGIWHRPGGRPA